MLVVFSWVCFVTYVWFTRFAFCFACVVGVFTGLCVLCGVFCCFAFGVFYFVCWADLFCVG